MVTKIKTDKYKNIIEVEGEQDFVKEIYQDFFSKQKQSENYQKDRKYIAIFLFIISIVTFVSAFYIYDEFLKKIFFGFTAGLVGLNVRNIIFLSGIMEEKPRKKLYWSYLAYFLFVVASSLLIFGLLNLSVKITTTTPDLFYFFLIPLNFYIGLITYSAIDFLKSMVNKNL